jgi:exopolysaccharide biosynthesis polyprenyl glycosylphosphotransferase
MKKAEIIFSTILVPIDYILLVLAGLSAYGLRYSQIYTSNIREVVFSLSFDVYFQYVAMFSVAWVLIFALAGLYSMRPNRKLWDVLNRIFFGCSTGSLFLILFFFFSRELFSSRFIIIAAWVIAIVYISFSHIVIGMLQKVLYRKGIGMRRVFLVGGGSTGEMLAGEFKSNYRLGYKIVGWSLEVSGELVDKIKDLVHSDKIDEIVQADPNLSREQTLALMNVANEYHLDFKYAADLLGARRFNFDIRAINGIPLVEIKKTPLDGWGRVVKRLFDIVGSSFALVLFSPIFLVLSILIKIDSKGPVIYRTERVGARGKKFNLFKFRSMIQGADKMKQDLMNNNERPDGPLFKMKNDPRITKIGKFMRRTSLDEFPNFWNVFIGNLSMVGPRPHEPEEVEKYEKHHRKLLNIKPGITGMAQVSGRSGLSFEDEVKLDTMYIETWSMWLDVIIVVKTPWVLLKMID